MRARIVELERIMVRRNQNKLGSDLLNDRILEGLNKDLTDTQIQLSALKTRYKSKHPKMVNLANRADVLEDEFEGKLNKSYNSLLIEDSILRSREEALQYAIKEYKKTPC